MRFSGRPVWDDKLFALWDATDLKTYVAIAPAQGEALMADAFALCAEALNK